MVIADLPAVMPVAVGKATADITDVPDRSEAPWGWCLNLDRPRGSLASGGRRH